MINILLFGTGEGCRIVKNSLNYNSVHVIACIDNDKSKHGEMHDNHVIISPIDICNLKYDYIIIASQYFEDIKKQLIELNVNIEQIISFFDYEIINNLKLIGRICVYEWRKWLINKRIYETLNSNDLELFATGISYTFSGIDSKRLSIKSTNLALGGQDLYYDFKIAEKVILNTNNKFKYAILGLCYYSFEYDLSKSINKYSSEYVYSHIVGSIHNYDKRNDKEYKKLNQYSKKIFEYCDFINKLFNEKELNELVENNDFGMDIFDKNWQKNFIYVLDNDIPQKAALQFKKLNSEEKMTLAKNMAIADCNKNYPETVLENIQILRKYLKLLSEKNIIPIVVVFPTNKFYYKNFDSKLKNQFYNIINDIKKDFLFEVWDFFDNTIFDDNDFRDPSHLNQNGREKMSLQLNGLLSDKINK